MEENSKKRKKDMVHVRGGFSDTTGIAPLNKTIQLDEFDDNTRIKISNTLFSLFEQVFEFQDFYPVDYNNPSHEFCKELMNDVFGKRNMIKREGYIYNWREVFELIHKVIEQATYNEVLDVIQYSCQKISRLIHKKEKIFLTFNELFEQEYVGYRFVNNEIVAITDKLEIETIENACENPIEGCRVQIQKALSFIADRENKDYKNSIKESISAVESICKVIVGDKKASLCEALRKLEEKGLTIHPSLKQAFLKLYGYTSDQGGIRHAEGMFESEVSFEEAKFMLVSCSAFINYLIAEMGKRR